MAKLLSEIVPHFNPAHAKPSASTEISGLTVSSSSVVQGSLFFAIKGTTRDGHDFIEDALAKGASVCVVDRKDIFEKFPKMLWVPSVKEVVGEIASRWWGKPSQKLNVIGVTGTNGTTTTTYLVQQLWKNLGLKSGVIGTTGTWMGDEFFPTELTTPDALQLQQLFYEMNQKEIKGCAMEVSSIALDQGRTLGTQFSVGVFTNLTQDHLDYHQTFENYYDAKKRFFTDHELKVAVINVQDPWGKRLYSEIPQAKKISFGLQNPKFDYTALDWELGSRYTSVQIKTPEGQFSIHVPLFGRHNIMNVLGAFAALHALGYKTKDLLKNTKSLFGAPGRLERAIDNEKLPLVFVDYAHTPDALEKVLICLEEIRQVSKGKIITVFGCGGDRDKEKRPLMGKIAAEKSNRVVITSDNPRTEDPEKIIKEIEKGMSGMKNSTHLEVDRKTAIHFALSDAKANDIVLIAGKGHETYQILGKEKIPFDDRKVVQEYYK